jgi:hypothetical protein
MTDVTNRRRSHPALCGAPYHPIGSCLACKRLYMRLQRQKNRKPRRVGFRGPECLECGGVNSKVAETGYTDDGDRIRRRECLDCGQSCASVEVYIDPAEATFWKLNGKRIRTKRENDYARRGKGVFRAPVKWRDPDRLEVEVKVVRSRQRAA